MLRRTVLAALGLVLAGNAAVAQIEQVQNLPGFTQIKAVGSTDIVVEVGPAQSVRIEGNPRAAEMTILEVRDQTLYVTNRSGSYEGEDARVVVRTPRLEALTIAGSSDARIFGLRGDRFVLTISGSGDVVADGSIDRLDVTISGSGDANFARLRSREVLARVSGSGSIRVSATDALDAKVSGSGDIFYSGNPQRVSTNVSGSGTIRRQ